MPDIRVARDAGDAQESRFRAVFRRAFSAGPYRHEGLSKLVLSVIVVGRIAVLADVDRTVRSVSLAPLYVLPLALSALVHRLRTALALSVVCLAAQHRFGPVGINGVAEIYRDAVTVAGYVFVVVSVHQLGRQRARLAEEIRRQRDELAAELRMAAEVQQSILPRTVPQIAGLDIAARMSPAKMIAGDYYGFLPLADGDLAVVIADVAGKGVAAGLLMPSIEVALRLDAPRAQRTSDLIKSFNRVVYQVTRGERFISLFYARLSPRLRRLEYTNAGHNPPLLLRSGGFALRLDCGGPVLGVVPDAQYESQTTDLREGDVLVLYTDGIVEAENSDGEFYSVDRLQQVAMEHMNQSAEAIAQAICASVQQFQGDRVERDDVTLVVLKLS